MGRIPSAADVAKLTRDDWEDLCRNLAAIIHQAQGVEDRHGKGNGLDMIRIDPDGASGWQFRRFDDRFEDKQAAKVLESVRLAARRCEMEDNTKLARFSLWANVDLEPGHKGSKGERERFAIIAKTAHDELGVVVEFFGVTWVRAQLLMRPTLRPDLFEDVPAQIVAVQDQLREHGDDLKELKALVAEASRSSAPVKRLVEQALVHFERGQAHGSAEEFRAASTCFRDAANLLHGLGVDPLLEGRILIASAGVQRMLGELPGAEATARDALAVIPSEGSDYIAQAKGTLALVLQDMQRFDECEALFRQAFDHFESQAIPLEIVRSLTHLVEFALNTNNLDMDHHWVKRLRVAILDVESLMGVSDVSMAGSGALGRVLFETGRRIGSKTLLNESEQLFAGIEQTARQIAAAHLTVAALGQRAEAVRFQDRLAEAATLYKSVVVEADRAEMAKAAADALYSLAIVENERGRMADARENMLQAHRRYVAIGDAASAEDATSSLVRWSQLGTSD